MPNKLNFRQITLALAAVFQSCYLADEIAMTGKTDEKNFNYLIQPIFNLNPKNFSELYHDPKYLKQGLHELQKVFNKKAGPLFMCPALAFIYSKIPSIRSSWPVRCRPAW